MRKPAYNWKAPGTSPVPPPLPAVAGTLGATLIAARRAVREHALRHDMGQDAHKRLERAAIALAALRGVESLTPERLDAMARVA